MNIRRCFIIGILLCGIGILNAQVVITSEAEQRAKEIVAKMTLKEKLRYISGYTGGFSICPVPRLGLPVPSLPAEVTTTMPLSHRTLIRARWVESSMFAVPAEETRSGSPHGTQIMASLWQP